MNKARQNGAMKKKKIAFINFSSNKKRDLGKCIKKISIFKQNAGSVTSGSSTHEMCAMCKYLGGIGKGKTAFTALPNNKTFNTYFIRLSAAILCIINPFARRPRAWQNG